MSFRDRRNKREEVESLTAKMREGGEAPDCTASILMRVDDQRAFLSGRDRRKVWLARGFVGVLAGCLALTSALLYRYSEQVRELSNAPAPMSRVITAVKSEAAQQADQFRQTLVLVAEAPAPKLTSVMAGVAAAGRGSVSGTVDRGAGAPATASCFVGPTRTCCTVRLGDDAFVVSGTIRLHGVQVSTPTGPEPMLFGGVRAARFEPREGLAAQPAGSGWMRVSSVQRVQVSPASSIRVGPLVSPAQVRDESLIPK